MVIIVYSEVPALFGDALFHCHSLVEMFTVAVVGVFVTVDGSPYVYSHGVIIIKISLFAVNSPWTRVL